MDDAHLLAIAVALSKLDDAEYEKIKNTSSEIRTLFFSLYDRGFIEKNITCDTIYNMIKDAKQLPKKSASRSIQFYDVDVGGKIEINVNEKKIEEILGQILGQIYVQPSHIWDLLDRNILQSVKTSINKTLNLLFAKLSASSSNRNDAENMFQKRESYFCEKIFGLIQDRKTPHVSSTFMIIDCDAYTGNFGNIVVAPIIEGYFEDQLGGKPLAKYKIIMTEMMKNSKSMEKFIKTEQPAIKDLNQIMFQIFYTLKIFEKNKIVHNDLHLGNIMIETLDKPFKFFYVCDVGKTACIESKYFVRIFDFDRSYEIDGSRYRMSPDIQYADHGNKNVKFDFFYVLKRIEYMHFKEFYVPDLFGQQIDVSMKKTLNHLLYISYFFLKSLELSDPISNMYGYSLGDRSISENDRMQYARDIRPYDSRLKSEVEDDLSEMQNIDQYFAVIFDQSFTARFKEGVDVVLLKDISFELGNEVFFSDDAVLGHSSLILNNSLTHLSSIEQILIAPQVVDLNKIKSMITKYAQTQPEKYKKISGGYSMVYRSNRDKYAKLQNI